MNAYLVKYFRKKSSELEFIASVEIAAKNEVEARIKAEAYSPYTGTRNSIIDCFTIDPSPKVLFDYK